MIKLNLIMRKIRNFKRFLPISFTNLLLDQKFTVIGSIAGILAFILTVPAWVKENTEWFKNHQVFASVVRPQETLGLDSDDTIGTYIIFENKGDYPEIITRIRAELYLPFQINSSVLRDETPDVLALQVQRSYSKESDRRVSEFLKEGGYIQKRPSRLPHFVDSPEYKNIFAFGGKLNKSRYVLQGCNKSIVITDKKPQNVVTKASHFRLPVELTEAIKNYYLLVESGVYDDSIFALFSSDEIEVEYFIGELLIVIEFINKEGLIDRNFIDGTNVFLVASKTNKHLKFSDWWNGFPGHFQLKAELRKSELLHGKKFKFESKVAKGTDHKEYILSISDMPMNMATPTFFESHDNSLCALEQVSISK